MSEQKTIFERFNQVLEEKLGPIANVVASNRYVLAVRNGAIATVPLTIVGGLSLILAFPPIDPSKVAGDDLLTQCLLVWHGWAQAHFVQIMMPFFMTMGIMALFMAMAVGYNLASSYKLNALSGSVMSAATFLMVSAPASNAVLVSKITDGMEAKAIAQLGINVLPTIFLDAKGIFTAIIIGILSVEILRFMKEKKVVIKMPEGVPPAVASSFEVLLPMIVNIFLFYTISLFFQSHLGMVIPEAIMKLLAPLVGAVDSVFGVFVLVVLCQLMWFMGLHGSAIVTGVAGPFWGANIIANATSKIAGQPLEHIFTGPFWGTYIVLGGSGATMALAFMLLCSKSKQLKATGDVAILPALFNINEPVIFGMPLVLNPVMAIPFIFVPALNGVLAFLVTKMGMANPAFVEPPWTTPAPISGFLATMDWRPVVLVLGLIVLDAILYYPFFKMYEKQLLQQEQSSEPVSKNISG